MKFKTNFLGKPRILKKSFICNFLAKTHVHPARSETLSTLHNVLESLFTPPPPRKQYALNIQITSHYYKTEIVRHLTHYFSSLFIKKNQPLSRAETSQIQRGTRESIIFSLVLNLRWNTVKTPASSRFPLLLIVHHSLFVDSDIMIFLGICLKFLTISVETKLNEYIQIPGDL